tara:strand:- start:4052 stop:5875 length:1824 start_codon:yes stop_codon:yes gene_type:complete
MYLLYKNYIFKVVRTISNIGIKRIIFRLIFEIRKYFDSVISSELLKLYTLINNKTPKWIKYSKYKSSKIDFESIINFNKKNITFNFLNEKKSLKIPITWHSKKWSTLWTFNLHYFDWARDWTEDFLKNKKIKEDIFLIKELMDQWIDKNKLGKGIGWNSYTTSLRIKNWVFIFRIFPNLLNKRRLDSLWLQICWLNNHKEFCYGGNHLIENLTALIIGSLQFDNQKARIIYKENLTILKKELEIQILKDGGHEERSASYHLLILDRLIEMGFYLEISKNERPIWLIKAITKMTNWIIDISLNKGSYPRFNDCTFNSRYSLNKVKNFAFAYLGKKNHNNNGYRIFLINSNNQRKSKNKYNNFKINNKNLINLKETGWTIIKPTKEWELLFKCGKSCPDHLPAHCHSDLLSFDLIRSGEPFFSEFGTSIYGNNELRQIERSSLAHNIFQLSYPINNLSKDKLIWIEPIEVWGNFRAGKKAISKNRNCGKNTKGEYWVEGSHDGYENHGASYKRNLYLKFENNKLYFKTEDFIINKKKMAWRQLWHLGPNIPERYLKTIIKQFKNLHNCSFDIIDTWHSKDFGTRIPRKSLLIRGFINPGTHLFKVRLVL